MALREDARRNRKRIVEAAIEVFRDDGAVAPLDLVARRAGVGRGTLYRHFPDRGALVAAVLRRQVDVLEAFAAGRTDADLLEELLVEMCWFELDTPGVMAVVRGQAVPREDADDVLERSRALLERGLAAALEAGAVDPSTTVEDLFLVVGMVDAVAVARGLSPGPFDASRAVRLALRGLRTPPRLDLPVPEPRLRAEPPV